MGVDCTTVTLEVKKMLVSTILVQYWYSAGPLASLVGGNRNSTDVKRSWTLRLKARRRKKKSAHSMFIWV